jgi:hypothetical protein
MIGRLETSKVHQINKIAQKTEDYQQYDVMTRLGFVSTKLLAQKSIKTKLRLKRYRVLKF